MYAKRLTIKQIRARAKEVAARYGSGDKIDAMPWTRDERTNDELREWLASRREAGRKINVATCELGWWYANDLDPYDVLKALGELPKDRWVVGGNHFVRTPESCGWVSEDDLPELQSKALHDRIDREARIYREANTYEHYLKQPKERSELWQAKKDFWRMVQNYACSIKWNAEDQAAAALDLRELGAELCKTQVLHPELFSGKGDRAIQSVSELVKSIINTILSDRNEPLHCGVGRDD
jgi:hypothetical protein